MLFGFTLCKLSILGFLTVQVEQRNLTTSVKALGNCDVILFSSAIL